MITNITDEKLIAKLYKSKSPNFQEMRRFVTAFLWHGDIYDKNTIANKLLNSCAKDDVICKSIKDYNLKRYMTFDIEKHHAELTKTILTPYISSAKSILDIGCGTGKFAEYLGKELKADAVYGADIPSWERYGNSNRSSMIKFVELVGDGTMNIGHAFELVCCIMSLHHIKDYEVQLKSAIDAVISGGYLFIREHNCTTEADRAIIDMAHKIYMYMETSTDDFSKHLKQYYAYYRTAETIMNDILKFGKNRSAKIIAHNDYDARKGVPKIQKPYWILAQFF